MIFIISIPIIITITITTSSCLFFTDYLVLYEIIINHSDILSDDFNMKSYPLILHVGKKWDFYRD